MRKTDADFLDAQPNLRAANIAQGLPNAT